MCENQTWLELKLLAMALCDLVWQAVFTCMSQSPLQAMGL